MLNSNQCIVIAVSQFNPDITEELLAGACAELVEQGVDRSAIRIHHVPGAVEIPLIASQCAKQADTVAVIALGAVIRGETSHYDVVCQQVGMGCQQVALQYDKPVIFGVLTTDNKQQALDRIGGAHGHKGRDAAQAALDMINLMTSLSASEVQESC